MMMHHECILCNLKQVYRIIRISDRTDEEARRLVALAMEYLSKVDYAKTNSEIMGETWKLITGEIGNGNPYNEIKEHYNSLLLREEENLRKVIECSANPLYSAVRLSALGNQIDFAGKRETSFILDDLYQSLGQEFAIDHSKLLFDDLEKAKMLLYLGDNCGEIVLDKLFLQQIKKQYPKLSIVYGVRGNPVVNDVTMDDANFVGMNTVAEILENGSGALGTVLDDTSQEFQDVFTKSDLVISKGQGNFESLSDHESTIIYHIMMVKCERIAEKLDVPEGTIVCMKNNRKM